MGEDQSGRRSDLWATVVAGGGVACAVGAAQEDAIEALASLLAHVTIAPLMLAGICRGVARDAAERRGAALVALVGGGVGGGIGAALAAPTASLLLGLDLAAGLSAVVLGLLIAVALARPWALALAATAIGAAAAGCSIVLLALESAAPLVAIVTTTSAAVASFGLGRVLGGFVRSTSGETAVRLVSGWVAAAALMVAGVNAASSLGDGPPVAAVAQAAGPVTATTIDLDALELRRVVETLLARVYRAFEHNEEAATYDALAEAVSGDTLEALYLQRRSALARASDGGAAIASVTLERSSLIDADRARGVYRIDAAWEVVGIIGHATHQHIRRNAYEAEVTVLAIDGEWRIGGFELSDMRRETSEDIPHEGEAAAVGATE